MAVCGFVLGLAGCGPQAEAPEPAAAVAPAEDTALDAAVTITFTEGPTVDDEGNVYFTDTYGNRIVKLAGDGQWSVFREPSNRANGLLFDQEGRLIACEGSDEKADRPRLTRTNVQSGEVEVIAERYQGKRLNQPNDVTMDSQGRLYFSDRPRTNPAPDQTNVDAVYRIDPDGTLTQVLVEPDIDKPNGLVISPDDKTFYLIEANGEEGGARMIRAYDLQPDGSVSNMRVFHDFYPGRSGDGMTIDSEGNLYVAAGLNRRRGTSETLDTKCGVHVFSPDGQLKKFIPVWEDTITNCAFGGPEWKTLYITAGKTLFRYENDIRGTRR
jgi:gluconolactonase